MTARDRNANVFESALNQIIDDGRTQLTLPGIEPGKFKEDCPNKCGGQVIIDLRKQTGLAIVQCTNYGTAQCGSHRAHYFPTKPLRNPISVESEA